MSGTYGVVGRIEGGTVWYSCCVLENLSGETDGDPHKTQASRARPRGCEAVGQFGEVHQGSVRCSVGRALGGFGWPDRGEAPGEALCCLPQPPWRLKVPLKVRHPQSQSHSSSRRGTAAGQLENMGEVAVSHLA